MKNIKSYMADLGQYSRGEDNHECLTRPRSLGIFLDRDVDNKQLWYAVWYSTGGFLNVPVLDKEKKEGCCGADGNRGPRDS